MPIGWRARGAPPVRRDLLGADWSLGRNSQGMRLADCLQQPRSERKEAASECETAIIVISDGQELGSVKGPRDVLCKLIANAIVLDVVMLSTSDESRRLRAVCRMSGGLPFRPRTREEGLALFKQEAFLDINIRKSVLPDTGEITIERIAEAATSPDGVWATAAVNHAAIEAKRAFPLALPLFATSRAMRLL